MASNLDMDLTCPICLDYYTNPVLTRCGHNFCRSCLSQVAAEDGELEEEVPGESVIRCPQCRSDISLEDVYTNRQLASVTESVRNLYISTQVPRQTKCKTHQEQLKVFCRDDWQPICLICALSQAHKQHTCVPIDEAVAECKENLQQPLEIMEERLREYRTMQQSQGEKISNLLKMTESLREKVGKDLSAMHCFLDEQEELLIRRLAEEEERILTEMEKNVALITKESETIKIIISDIQPWFNTPDPQQLLQDYRDVLQRYESVLPYYPVLNEPKSNLGEFTGPLQYTVWKKMLGIIKPAPAMIFFDPMTANPHLDLSRGGSKIQFRKKPHQIPSTPARFSHRTGVLASVGMDSGQHYWEVEITEGTTWSLGVVAEATNRKAALEPTPQNRFWTVGHQSETGFWAYTAEKSSLNPDMNLRRIGVFLDYKAGRLSFYDAEDMSHIFTFKEKFRETLRPYFYLDNAKTGNQPSMELFQLRL